MMNEKALQVVFFRTQSGREYVRDWLTNLPDKEEKAISLDISHVQKFWPIGKPIVDHIGNGIWEIRTQLKTRWARILFCLHKNKIVLLHGFMKKSNRTPRKDIEIAENRMKKL